MTISGLQKLTLLDYPGKVACTVFTGGCNLRCPFCHNAPLVTDETPAEIPQKEVLSFLQKRSGLLDGVCVTGGEPLLHPDLPELLRQIRALGYAVKLDTNGCFPERLQSVMEEGLVDYVAMDLKNAPDAYAQTVGVPDFSIEPIYRSAELLLRGRVAYEFRTTVVRGLHTAAQLRDAAQMIRGAAQYFLQKFVDSGHLIDGNGMSAFTDAEMRDLLKTVAPYVQYAALRGI